MTLPRLGFADFKNTCCSFLDNLSWTHWARGEHRITILGVSKSMVSLDMRHT